LLIISFSKAETVDQWPEVGKSSLDFIRPEIQESTFKVDQNLSLNLYMNFLVLGQLLNHFNCWLLY